MAKRRRRGVVLTPEGLEKFQKARLREEAEHNYGESYSYEQLSDITYLDMHTIKRVLECQEGVDKRTLERLFISFGIELDQNSYTKPSVHTSITGIDSKQSFDEETYRLLKENYQLAIANYEEKYKAALKSKDEEIEMYKKQIKTLKEIIESLSKNPIVIEQIKEG